MYSLKTINDLPFAPCLAPWVRKSWLKKITVEKAPDGCRVWGRVLEGPCWLFHGSCNGKGHRKVRVQKRLQYLHRYSFSEFHGIPLAFVDNGDHLCRNRNCFQPLHIDNVTSLENWLRGDGHLTTFKTAEPTQADEDLVAALRGY